MAYRSRTLAVLASAFLLTSAACAFDPLDLKDLDKAVFDGLAARASETVNITLDGSLLKMAAGFLSSGDDEDAAKLKRLVSGLKSVHVRSFEFKKPGEYRASDVEAIRNVIKSPEWSRIVDVHNRDDGDNVEIYILPGKDKPQGMFLLSTEPLELTVVHIVGQVDISDLAALHGLGVPDFSNNRGMKGK